MALQQKKSGNSVVKTILILVFFGPGKIIAHYEYLFPKRGDLWASSRRKDNRYVHLFYSVFFYSIIIFIILIAHAKPHG